MILSVDNGIFGYKKGKNILENINFTVKTGEVLAILGPNGVGKTTLLKCIIGYLKWNSGATLIDGTNISNMPQNELWQKIAYVPQAKTVACSYTVREFILLGRSSRIGFFSQPSARDIMLADKAADTLGIDFLLDKKCDEISGGELQMVLIAKALASEPEILILDEPESNLDFKNQLTILETITALSQNGTACIFNTHYPAHAMRRADKALLLGQNGDILFGSAPSVITEENIERAFGVKTIIGEMETEHNIVKDIVPVSASEKSGALTAHNPEKLAVISIVTDFKNAEKINSVLHEYRDYIIGRMGMPCRKYGENIINVIFDAPYDILEAAAKRLNDIPDVSIKTVFSKK